MKKEKEQIEKKNIEKIDHLEETNEELLIKASITNHIQKLNNNTLKQKTYYVIEIRIYKTTKYNRLKELNTWKEEKTYEEFEKLYQTLKKHHSKTIPKFVSKSVFASKTPDNLNKWKNNLEDFIKSCLTKKDIKNDTEFTKFLNLSKYEIEQSDKLSKLDSYTSAWPVIDFLQMPDSPERLLVTSCDGDKLSQLDAYLNNLDHSGPTIPVSGCRIIRISNDGFVLDKNDFNFSKTLSCSHVYSCYISADKILTDKEKIEKKNEIKIVDREDRKISIISNEHKIQSYKNFIVNGFTNGYIYILEDSSEHEFIRLISRFSSHKGKVIATYLLDEKTLITLSKNTLKLWNLDTLSIITTKKLDNKATLSHFNFDKARITLGCENGYVECYTINSHVFTLIEKIRLSCKTNVKEFNFCDQMLFIASDKGFISQLNIIENFECYNLVEKRYFKSNFSITSLAFNKNTDEIIIGDNKGLIVFFNVKGEVVYSKKINSNSITKIVTFSNLILTASKDKVVSIYKINNVHLNEEDNILKRNSVYGQLMINNSQKNLDQQFNALLSEPITKNLKVLKDDECEKEINMTEISKVSKSSNNSEEFGRYESTLENYETSKEMRKNTNVEKSKADINKQKHKKIISNENKDENNEVKDDKKDSIGKDKKNENKASNIDEFFNIFDINENNLPKADNHFDWDFVKNK